MHALDRDATEAQPAPGFRGKALSSGSEQTNGRSLKVDPPWEPKAPQWEYENRTVSSSNVTTKGVVVTGSTISQMLRLSKDETVSRPYVQVGAVYGCIRAIRSAATQPRMALWNRDPEEDDDAKEVEAENDPVLKLLRRWNPLMSTRKGMGAIVTHYLLAGGSALFLSKTVEVRDRKAGSKPRKAFVPIEPGDIPTEMWPVRGDTLTIELDEVTGLPAWYEAPGSAGKIRYPAHAVAYIYEPDPENPFRGLGPMQAAARAANVDYKARAFDDALVSNGGQIGGVMKSTNGRNPTDPQIRQMQEQMKNARKPENRGAIPLLPADIDFLPITFSPEEMQLGATKEEARDSILSIFGVPKTLLGYTDDVNRANAREVTAVFYSNTVFPLLAFISDEFDNAFFSKLPAPYNKYTWRADKDSVMALRATRAEIIKDVLDLLKVGTTLREAVHATGWELNVDDGPDGKPFINADLPLFSGYTSLSEPVVPAALGGDEDEDGEDEDEPNKPADEQADDDQDEQGEAGQEQTRSRQKAQGPDVPASPTAQKYASGLSHSERRRLADSFDKVLAPVDRSIEVSVRKVFRTYIQNQKRKLRDVARGITRSAEIDVAKDRGHDFPEWFDCDPVEVPKSFDRYAALLGHEPSRQWYALKAISEKELEALLLRDIKDWGEQLWRAVEPDLRDAWDTAAERMAEQLSGQIEAVSTASPEGIALLAAKEIALTEGPMSVVAQMTKRALLRAVADSGGAAVGPLSQRVAAVLDDLVGALTTMQTRIGERAVMIARTETTAVANAASVAQMKREGVLTHEWLSERDGLVRDGHRIDGEVRALGQPFSNGLKYPGDPDGPVGLLVNCRCSALPVRPRE